MDQCCGGHLHLEKCLTVSRHRVLGLSVFGENEDAERRLGIPVLTRTRLRLEGVLRLCECRALRYFASFVRTGIDSACFTPERSILIQGAFFGILQISVLSTDRLIST